MYAMVSTNLAGVIETWNPAAEKLFGYLLDEAQGKSLSILAPPDMTGEFKSMLATAVRGDSVQVETVRRCKDGTLIDVAFSVMPIKTKNSSGQIHKSYLSMMR